MGSDARGKFSGYGLFVEDVRRFGWFALCVKEWKVEDWKKIKG